jgi:hypothetical protein
MGEIDQPCWASVVREPASRTNIGVPVTVQAMPYQTLSVPDHRRIMIS